MITSLLGSIFTFFERITTRTFSFLGDLFGYLFQKLFDFLKMIFSPIFILVAIIFYVLYKIAELVVTLIKVLLAIGKLFFALVKGIFTTLAGFTFTPSSRDDGQWTSIFGNVVSGLEHYQLDALAYVLMFAIWFATAFAAVRILSSIRGGGDD